MKKKGANRKGMRKKKKRAPQLNNVLLNQFYYRFISFRGLEMEWLLFIVNLLQIGFAAVFRYNLKTLERIYWLIFPNNDRRPVNKVLSANVLQSHDE